VADKRCDNGHFIDEAWDICPYCPQDESEPEIPVVRPRSIEQSSAQPNGNGGAQPNSAAAPPTAARPAAVPSPSPMPRALPSLASAAHAAAHASPPAHASAERAEAHGAPRPRPITSSGRGAAAIAVPPPAERTVAAQRLEVGQQQKRYVVGWLVGLNGPSRGEAFPVRMGRNVIGRDKRSDILINDDQASSHHADLVFRPEERRFILMDHNSTNGTYVNETEIEPRRDLIENDVVRIGSHRFLFSPLCHDGFHWDDEGPLK
jgi:hypothetical protein